MTNHNATNQSAREFALPLSAPVSTAEVKIRYREVIVQRPNYGRFPEYQVVLGRKILSRHDTRSQAEKWARENGHTVAA